MVAAPQEAAETVWVEGEEGKLVAKAASPVEAGWG